MNGEMRAVRDATEPDVFASVDATHATRGVRGSDVEGVTVPPLCFKPNCIPARPPVSGRHA